MEQTKVKKPRALPCIWKRFFALSRGEPFTVGKTHYNKQGFCYAQTTRGATVFLKPWTRVRTTERVAGLDTILKQPVRAKVEMFSRTHYVGDDCLPAHPSIEQTGPSA